MPAAPDPRLAVTPPEAAVEERVLLRKARAGDREAFERLAVRAMPKLMGAAQRILRQRFAAEEAVADALFKAWRHIAGFRGDSGFATWAHRIVCRVATDRFRAQARERRHAEALAERSRAATPAERDPGARLDAVGRLERLRGAIDRLPARQRLVVVLHAWEGLSLRETAEIAGIRYATAKSNLCHARKALRLWLEEDEA